MKGLLEEKIKTDVLVVGAGAGGMMAAITAADCGVEVTLCEKGHARRSGGITGGNDHFQCYIPEIHGLALKEDFVKESMKDGLADEDVVRTYIDRSHEVVRKWENWGITMKTDGHYEFTGHSWPGSSGRLGEPGKTNRKAIHFSDENISPKLEAQARGIGVHIINRVMITDLLRNSEGHIAGAIGISTREPKLLIIQAKSVILNTGSVNPNRLYPPPHLIGYSMADPATGDGDIMAYKVGADLHSAEIFKRRQVSLKFGPWSGKGTWIGVLRDAEGKPIAPPYLSGPDPETGDPAVENDDAFDHIQAMGKGPIWMDPRGISDEEEQYMRWGFKSEALLPFLNWLDTEKIDIKKTRFEFTVMQPATRIKPRINANFETTIQGLYAVIRENLPRSAVGGLISGEAAAKNAERVEALPLNANRKIALAKQKCDEILNRQGQEYADWREVQWAIWQIMHCYALPPHRTESTITAGYGQLLRLRDRTYKILKASNQHDLYHCLEVLNLMDIAELVLLSVKERRESRGPARRQDYPFINPMLNKLLVVTQKNGKPAFRWENPRRLSAEA